MTELHGKVAVVTGGAIGIGREIAVDLARLGASVHILDVVDAGGAAAEVRDRGGAAETYQADVSDAESLAKVVEQIGSVCRGVDIVVNNAGLFTTLSRAPFDELDIAQWRRVLDVNVTGPFLVSRAFLPLLKKSAEARIINITSATVFSAPPMMLHYVASKGALTAMTRSMARELGKWGITVNAVAPGFTLSDGLLANRSELFEVQAARARDTRCLSRDQMPADVVGAVAFLAGSGSRFITGQTIVVDGGAVMN